MSNLSTRQQSIFCRVVDLYIETAHPVGSKSITDAFERLYSESYSSATVRYEMGRLEHLGYLTHPHTSAGRTPTDRGYRYYVDHSLRHEPVGEHVVTGIEERSRRECKDLDELGEQVCGEVSKLAEEMSVLIIPVKTGRRFVRPKVFTRGAGYFLKKPEFQEVEKIRDMFQRIEDRNSLLEVLANDTDKAIMVSIGVENKDTAFKDCSIVSCQFEESGDCKGVVAVIGPKRMKYSRTIPVVQQIARMADRIFCQSNF